MSIHYYDQPQPDTAVHPRSPHRLYDVGTRVIFVRGASNVENIAVAAA
jgi:hypothetical protein